MLLLTVGCSLTSEGEKIFSLVRGFKSDIKTFISLWFGVLLDSLMSHYMNLVNRSDLSCQQSNVLIFKRSNDSIVIKVQLDTKLEVSGYLTVDLSKQV